MADEAVSGRDYGKRFQKEAREAFAKHEISERGEGRWILQTRYTKPPEGWDWMMAAEIVALRGRLYVGGDISPVIFGCDNGSPRAKVAWMGGTNDVGYYVHQKACIGMGVSAAEGVTDQFNEEVARWTLEQYINERMEDVELPMEVEDALMLLDSVDEWDEDEDADGPLFPYLERDLGEKWWPKLKARLGDVTAADAAPICKEFKGELEKLARAELEQKDPVCEVLRDAIKWALDEGHHRAVNYIYDRLGRVDPEFMSERYDFGMVCAPRVYYAWGAVARLHELLKQEEKEREGEADTGGTERNPEGPRAV